MDAKYYCDQMHSELTATKARIYAIMREMERVPEDNREAAARGVAEMNRLVDDLTQRIDRLNTECPTDWAPEKEKLETMNQELKEKIDLWDAAHIAGGYVGG